MNIGWRRWTIAAVGLVVFAGTALAEDWPQWRGPERDGVSLEKGLLKQWPSDGPKLLWEVKNVGGGFSTPAVVGDHLYLLGNNGLADESVMARQVSNGGVVWSAHLGKVGEPNQQPSYPGARSTPTVDGELLYALGSDGDLACIESATGHIRWKKSLRTDFGGKPGKWAYAESPLIDGDAVVCTPGGAAATIVSLNKKTGDVIWKSALGDEAAYASIVIDQSAGVKQYVQFLATAVVGVDAKTGTLLWRYEATAKGSAANIATPVVHGDYVYSAAGQSGGGLVKLAGNAGKLAAQQVYFDNKLPTAIGGAVLVGDNLFGTSTSLLMCVDFKTGKIKWKNRSIGPSSIEYADGNLYLHSEQSGDVALVQAAADGYHEAGHFMPPDMPEHSNNSKSWAYPVVANGKLYIRDLNVLWCYQVK